MGMSSNWIRVVSGISLVGSSLVKQVSKNGESMANFAARHGIDFSNNMKVAANAAFMQQQNQYYRHNRTTESPKIETNMSREFTSNNDKFNSTSSMNGLSISNMNKIITKEDTQLPKNADEEKILTLEMEKKEFDKIETNISTEFTTNGKFNSSSS